jgi:hypothetical protein
MKVRTPFHAARALDLSQTPNRRRTDYQQDTDCKFSETAEILGETTQIDGHFRLFTGALRLQT